MMMKNYDQLVQINQNLNWLYIPDHLYRMLIIGGSALGKTNVIKVNKKSSTRYCQNLFVGHISFQIKVPIAYLQNRKSRN